MPTTSVLERPAPTTSRSPWRVVATGTAFAAALVQWTVSDHEALAAGAALAVAGLALQARNRLIGRLATVATILLLVNLLIWMVPAAWSNASHRGGTIAVALPLALVTLAVLGIASVLVARRPGGSDRAARAAVATAAATWFVVAGTVLVVGIGESQSPQPGDVEVTARNVAFSPDAIRVDAGPTGFVVTNQDLFWHTFTIDDAGAEVDVDVRVPVRGKRRIEVDLPPGTYRIICAIPGHESAGMSAIVVAS